MRLYTKMRKCLCGAAAIGMLLTAALLLGCPEVTIRSEKDVCVNFFTSTAPSDPNATRISTWQELQAIKANDPKASYILTKDITIPDGVVFTPIGARNATNLNPQAFQGTLDGNGFFVRNLSINWSFAYVGLIAYVGPTGVVKNLGVTVAAVNAASSTDLQREYVGAVAGENEGTVIAYVEGGSVRGGSAVGGVVGSNRGMLAGIANVTVTGATDDVGGLAGRNTGSVYGSSRGVINGTASSNNVGGLVGNNQGGNIVGFSTGAVHGSSIVGGLVGLNSSSGTVTGYSTASIDGAEYLGGLAGKNDNTTPSQNAAAVFGYARSVISTSFTGGSTTPLPVGELSGTQGGVDGYRSLKEGESVVFDKTTNRLDARTKSGRSGDPIDARRYSSSAAFKKFTFGPAVGQWEYTPNLWPTLNYAPASLFTARCVIQPNVP